MTLKKRLINQLNITLAFIVFPYLLIKGDGTKQLQTSDTIESRIQIMPSFSTFAIYDSPSDYKLYITIKEIGEKIYIGFGNIYDYYGNLTNDVKFRVISPSGNVVYGPSLIPTFGVGFINNLQEAINGPKVFNPLGYDAIEIQATEVGDYYIEFDMPKVPNWLVIREPDLRYMQAGLAEFGPPFMDTFFCKPIVYLPDSNDSYTGCSGYEPLIFNDKIALIDRGECEFTTKVLKAQNSGAIGAIIVNNVPGGGVFQMGYSNQEEANQIQIPSIMISYEDGSIIKQMLSNGETVIGCFGDSAYGYERRIFEYFDISVANDDGIIDGRVWSKAWQFTTIPYIGSSDPFKDAFYGKVFIYSTKDSIVTSFDFNGMRPFVFTMSANSFGCTNTNDIIDNRKSKYGLFVNPEYKIFLSKPDTSIFKIKDIGKLKSFVIKGCPPGPYSLEADITKPGLMQIIIDLDSIPGYQPLGKDIKIVAYFNEGINTILWNGNDNLGNPVPDTQEIKINIKYYNCESHTPLYDVEANPNGFIISLVYPENPNYKPLLFWDDTEIDGTIEISGCNSSTDLCHTWLDTISCFENTPCSLGDRKTINTWWYAGQIDTTIITTLALKINPIIKNISCFGNNDGEVLINISGGIPPYYISWDNGIENEFYLTNLSEGTYYFTLTDDQGCYIEDSINIYQPQILAYNVDSIKHLTCYMSNDGYISLKIIGGTEPYQIVWNTNHTSTTLENLSAQTYYFTITDFNQCQIIDSIIITQPPKIYVDIDSIKHNICHDGEEGYVSLNAHGGIPPYSISWNTGENNFVLENLSNGIYSYTITDFKNCKYIDSVEILSPLALTYNFDTLSNIRCFGENNGIISITVQGGTPPYSIIWNTNDTSFFLNNLPSNTYYFTITDNSNCTLIDSITIIEPTKLNVSIDTIINLKCFGDNDGKIIINANGGSPPYTFIIENLNIVQDSGIFTNLANGLYIIKVIDINNCEETAEAYIHSPEPIQLIIDSIKHPLCYNDSSGSIYITVTGGTPPYNFYWNNGSTNQNLINIQSNLYFLTIKDSNNCIYISDTITLQNPEPLIANISNIFNPVCNKNNGAIILNVLGGNPPYTFYWNNGEHTQNIFNLSPGNYNVTIYDANNCMTKLENISINSNFQESININYIKKESCKNYCSGEIKLFVSGGYPPYIIHWNTGDSSTTLTNLCEGNYIVYVQDSHECIDSLEIEINSFNTNTFIDTVIVQNSTCPGICNGKIIIRVGEKNPKLNIFVNEELSDTIKTRLCKGDYLIIIKDEYNCVDSAFVSIYDYEIPENEVPNIITPNNDGNNDFFIYQSVCELDLKLYILNRWGEIIYYTVGKKLIWNGYTNSGLKVTPGVYYYVIQPLNSESRFEKKGFLYVVY